jgi:dienelactone hydrolase
MLSTKLHLNTKESILQIVLLILATFVAVPVINACTLVRLSDGSLGPDPNVMRAFYVSYYYSLKQVNSDSTFDTRCRYFTNSDGQRMCEIKLVGKLYVPPSKAYKVQPGDPPAQFAALVVNHGSENDFDVTTKACEMAEYFVPKGYIVFAPFRRGQGGTIRTTGTEVIEFKSSGYDWQTVLNDYNSDSPQFPHPSNCSTHSTDCYLTEILAQQANQDVRAGVNFVEARSDVKQLDNGSGNYRLAIMGGSYGGRVTLYANTYDLGQQANVAFSAGAEGWGTEICSPDNFSCGSYNRQTLMAAARDGIKPIYFLQPRWDLKTNGIIDLAYAEASASSDPYHFKPFMASIFEHKKPDTCTNSPCTDDDYETVHATFPTETDIWGPSVLDFLKRHGVK